MNLVAAIGMVVLLGGLLAILGGWQRRIAEAQARQVRGELADAQARGAHQAAAQFPQINEQLCLGCGSCIAACPESGVIGLVEGVARVVYGSRCVGHGLCAEACPVGAIHVGLDPARPDLPALSDTLETSVPGLYIAGELGGLALIRVATEQGVAAIDAIANDLQQDRGAASADEPLDVLIVGAGPAGIAAALRAVEHGLRYAVIDQDDVGGTVRKYPRRKLTLTGAMTLPLVGEVKRRQFLKEELVEFWERILAQHRLEVRTGVRLQGLDGERGRFTAHTSGGPIHARRVLLALGRRGTPRRLGVEGEDREKVLYQLCDAATYTDQHVLVVGGGDSAVEAAVALAAQPGNVVTLSYRRAEFFRIKDRNREQLEQARRQGLDVRMSSRVLHIQEESVALAVPSDAGEQTLQLPNHYVFVCAGGEPPMRLLGELGVRMGGEDGSSTARPAAPALAATGR